MSWKPSRSSGVMLDRYKIKSEQARNKINELIESYEVLPFDKINEFSKYVYLFWLNDNKFSNTIIGNKSRCELNGYYISQYHLNILKRNINLVYKPFRKIIESN